MTVSGVHSISGATPPAISGATPPGRALVLGGAGFLGSHVADALVARGFETTIFDKAAPRSLRPGQTAVIGDICDAAAVAAAAQGCRYVYNFAAVADIDEAQADPRAAVIANVVGLTNVLEAARSAKAERLIYASTIYVFSKAGAIYRATKQAGEALIEAYQESYGVDFTILRYGSLYGRRADRRNNIRRMVEEALSRGEITYDGPEDAVREYIHAEDAAKLSVDILDPAYVNRHLVLTGQERFYVRDVMRMIADMAPHPVRLRFGAGASSIHYAVTPYAFQPRVGHKLTSNEFIDMGQGILDCMAEAHEALGNGGS